VPNVPYAWKSVWGHPTVVVIDVGQVEAQFSQFGDSVNLETSARFAANVHLALK